MTFKPVELFASDIHGEYEAFSHVLRGGCGNVRKLIDEVFGQCLDATQKDELLTLVVYPEEKLAYEKGARSDFASWRDQMQSHVNNLLEALRLCSSGELAEDCLDIQHHCVSRLHMLGDVYDRGPSPDLIMDELMAWPDVDIQWGNHDILWMGASLGQPGCVAHVVRICARYGNLSVLENTYGIDLGPLKMFAQKAYKDDPCAAFALKGDPDLSSEELQTSIKVQKAMAIIQFKAEARLIDENPSFGLESRKLLHKIDFERNTVEVDGVEHDLLDTVFPTVDPADPYALTDGEQAVLDHLAQAFKGNERLQRHIRFFIDAGSLYKVAGDNLLFHACVPMNPDGSLKEVTLFSKTLKGKSLFDAVDGYVREAFLATDAEAAKRGRDMLWYLWLGEGSPLFAKSKMATFELYYVADKEARKEKKNSYYDLLEDADALANIFNDFGMDPESSRIVCGHTPVKVKDGEDPVKCGGKALIIDGGFSKPYQKNTGIAGFTLVKDADGVQLATHHPFVGRQQAIQDNLDLQSDFRPVS